MSLYRKEKVEYARECFDSLLAQTVKADEWIIVEDGPLSQEMYSLLEVYKLKYPNLIKSVPLHENRGLGLALREGILHCSNELIARMDTDDIARNDRFEKQLEAFREHPNLDICGSHIYEFNDNINNTTAKRNVPLTDLSIKKYQKWRDAFNHMTVMYKKSSVLKAGNYQHALLMEDSLLWANMILCGAVCMNIDDYLVYARTGKDMFRRRGGWSYFKKYREGRQKILETGYISYWNYLITLCSQLIVALSPNFVRQFIYKFFLRDRSF